MRRHFFGFGASGRTEPLPIRPCLGHVGIQVAAQRLAKRLPRNTEKTRRPGQQRDLASPACRGGIHAAGGRCAAAIAAGTTATKNRMLGGRSFMDVSFHGSTMVAARLPGLAAKFMATSSATARVENSRSAWKRLPARALQHARARPPTNSASAVAPDQFSRADG